MDVRRRPAPRQPDQLQQCERSAGIFTLRFERYQFAVSYPDRLTFARRHVGGAHGGLSPPLLVRRYPSGLPSAKHKNPTQIAVRGLLPSPPSLRPPPRGWCSRWTFSSLVGTTLP